MQQIKNTPITTQTPAPKAVHIVTQLWGQSYIDLYAGYVIPTLLTQKNLPILKACANVTYEIYVPEKDKAGLESHQNFKRLLNQCADWIRIEIIVIEENLDNPYTAMSNCHRQAIARAEKQQAVVFFLQPDVLVGAGTIETAWKQLELGKRLVLAPGLRSSREQITAFLDTYLKKGHLNGLTVRSLVQAAVSNLHPISTSLLWRNGLINAYCSHLYWEIGNSSLYARCAHMHPLAVYPRNQNCGFKHTIDWDYFYRACSDHSEWFIARSSDEICLIELSPETKFIGPINQTPAESATLASFLIRASEKPHLQLIQDPYLFLGEELNDGEFESVHTEASAVVTEALNKLKAVNRFFTTPTLQAFRQYRPLIAEALRRKLVLMDENLKTNSIQHPITGSLVYYGFRFIYQVLRFISKILKH